MSSNIIEFPTPRANLAEFDLRVSELLDEWSDSQPIVDEIEEILEDLRYSVNCMSFDPGHMGYLVGIKQELLALQTCADTILDQSLQDQAD